MLPDRENSHCLQQATTWRQEGHRTLCPNPFHGHAPLPRERLSAEAVARKANLYQAEGHTHKRSVPGKESQPPITECLPLEQHCGSRPTEGARWCWFCSQQADQRPGSGRPAWTCTNRKVNAPGLRELTPPSSKCQAKLASKKEPFPSPTPTAAPAQEAVHGRRIGDSTENPSSLVLSRLPGSGKPLYSFGETVIPITQNQAHATVPENVTKTTSNFSRGTAYNHGPTASACPDTQWLSTEDFNHLPLHSLIEASSQVTIFWLDIPGER